MLWVQLVSGRNNGANDITLSNINNVCCPLLMCSRPYVYCGWFVNENTTYVIMFKMLMKEGQGIKEYSTSTDRRSLWRPYDDAHVTLFWNLEMRGDVIIIILNVIHFHAIHGGSLNASPHIQITSCGYFCTEKLAVQVNSCSSKQAGNVHPYWTRQYIPPLGGRI